MKKNLLLACLCFLIAACSNEDKNALPEMNAYIDDQNYVLERFQWLGFDPSLLYTQELKDGLSVIFCISRNVIKPISLFLPSIIGSFSILFF